MKIIRKYEGPLEIPKIDPARVVELATTIRPLVRTWVKRKPNKPRKLYRIEPCDLFRVAFNWDPKLVRPAKIGHVVAKILTLYTYGAPSFFKPSIAEVLAQIPAELLPKVAWFEVDGPDTAADMNVNFHAANEGFHVAETTLYARAA